MTRYGYVRNFIGLDIHEVQHQALLKKDIPENNIIYDDDNFTQFDQLIKTKFKAGDSITFYRLDSLMPKNEENFINFFDRLDQLANGDIKINSIKDNLTNFIYHNNSYQELTVNIIFAVYQHMFLSYQDDILELSKLSTNK